MTLPSSTQAAPPAPRARSGPGTHALEWWSKLAHSTTGDPGTLARLRRARSPAEALGVRAAVSLARRLGGGRADSPDWRVRASVDLARVLARVKTHDVGRHPMRAAGWKRFAGERRESDAGDDRPILSEARFKRLLQTGEGEEKVVGFTRLIALLDGAVKVDDLAADFLSWNHPEWGDRVRERWAFLYYAAGDAAPALPPIPSEDVEA